VIQETGGSGNQLASYILGGTELLTQTRGGNTSFYFHDGQGSVRTLTNRGKCPEAVMERHSFKNMLNLFMKAKIHGVTA